MQEIKVEVIVQFRSDGKVDRGKVQAAVAERFLGIDREALFANGATYAGYTAALPAALQKGREE